MPEHTAKEQPATDENVAAPRRTNGTFVGGLVSIIALLMLASTAASLFARLDWKADLLTHFRMQYAVVLLVTMLALAALRWKKMALVSAVGLAINLYFIAPLFWPTPHSPAPAELASDDDSATLTLLHFNVNTANPRKADVATLIRNSGADVVFLQEINQGWIDALDGQLPGYRLAASEPRTDNFGIGMWVREDPGIEVAYIDTFDMSDLDNIPAIDTMLRVDGIYVDLISLHTLPPISKEYAEIRDAQLSMATEMADLADIPFVLIGDLNATPWSSQYRAMVRHGGLTDSLCGRGVQVSWPAGMVKLGMIPIDHCLTRGNVVVTRRELGDATGSDHRPLFITLKIGG